jgi:ketosteroid isomerase-like protein
MSKENVEIVRLGLEHFLETRDFLEDRIAPEYVWDMSTFRGWPEQQTYEGLEGARDFIRTWADAWEDWTLELKELHDAGDKVVAVMHQHGRSKSTGLDVDMTFAQVFTLEGGRYVRMQMYADPAEALEATGLSK